MKIKTIVVVFAVCFASFILHADYAEEIDMKYLMPLLKNGKTDEAMTYLKGKLHSEDKTTRSGAYNVMGNWIYPRNPEYRKEIVDIWSSKLSDIYSSLELYTFLYNASPDYYTDTAKQNLLSAFRKKENLSKTIRLLGHANVREAIPLLKATAEKYDSEMKNYRESVRKLREEKPNTDFPDYDLRIRFTGGNSAEKALPYHEALARMGDKEEIDYCLNYFNQEVKRKALARKKNESQYTLAELMESSHISNVKNYAYIRQPETIDLLHKALLTKITYNMQGKDIPLNKNGFDALVQCLMIDDVIEKDRFGRFVPNKENIELLRKWMKEKYTPEKIKSLSVLIDGRIVNNYASSSRVTETKHTEKPVAKMKYEIVKIQSGTAPRGKTPNPDSSSDKAETFGNMKYLYLAVLCLGAVFLIVIMKRKKT